MNLSSDKIITQRETSDVEITVFNVSASPHVRSNYSISKIMWSVALALSPAVIFAIFHFGLPALQTLLAGSLSAVFFEVCVQKFRKKPITINDGSAFLSGLLLAMCLPPSVPFFVPIVGSFIAIVVAKHSMGGLGYNIFNPAHIGRAALMASWPMLMTTWTPMKTSVDVVSSATPLSILKHQGYVKLLSVFGGRLNMYRDMFLGLRNGSIGGDLRSAPHYRWHFPDYQRLYRLDGSRFDDRHRRCAHMGFRSGRAVHRRPVFPHDGRRACTWRILYGD